MTRSLYEESRSTVEPLLLVEQQRGGSLARRPCSSGVTVPTVLVFSLLQLWYGTEVRYMHQSSRMSPGDVIFCISRCHSTG